MSTAMRAKVRVTAVVPSYGQSETREVVAENLTFAFPSKDGGYPADGSDEDQQFAKFSPSGELRLTIANPNLLGKFKFGDTFYLDFVPVE